jgi:UPF0755 protein
MLKTLSRLLRLLLTIGLLLVICTVSVMALAVLLQFTSQGALGPSSAELGFLEGLSLRIYLLGNLSKLDAPGDRSAGEFQLLVEPGMTATDVIRSLRQAGLVENEMLLRSYMRYRGLDTSIEAGAYNLQGGMTTRQLAESLQTASTTQLRITVIEGWRREQIAVALSELGLSFSSDDFLVETAAGLDEFPSSQSLEGFLFPDTYFLDPEATPAELAQEMVGNFFAKVDDETLAGFERRGMTLYEAVTLASIVEREARQPEERPLIASVFQNRLSLNMKLEADPTVQYALGMQPDGNWWKSPLSLVDLQFDSPFNTYVYPGLPPAPVANPGIDALHSVAFPEDSVFLFFRARCDGSGFHSFAITLEEHIQNACP